MTTEPVTTTATPSSTTTTEMTTSELTSQTTITTTESVTTTGPVSETKPTTITTTAIPATTEEVTKEESTTVKVTTGAPCAIDMKASKRYEVENSDGEKVKIPYPWIPDPEEESSTYDILVSPKSDEDVYVDSIVIEGAVGIESISVTVIRADGEEVSTTALNLINF